RRLRYSRARPSRMSCNCFSASMADCLPTSMSCCGEKRLNPGLTCVCAKPAIGVITISGAIRIAMIGINCGRRITLPVIDSKLIRIDAQFAEFRGESGSLIFGLPSRCGLVVGALGFHSGAFFAGQDDVALLVAPAQPGVLPVLEDAVPE